MAADPERGADPASPVPPPANAPIATPIPASAPSTATTGQRRARGAVVTDTENTESDVEIVEGAEAPAPAARISALASDAAPLGGPRPGAGSASSGWLPVVRVRCSVIAT